MSRTISPSALQAMLARETAEVFLVTMRIIHSSFTTIRIVNNTEQITKDDGVYVPFPFSLQLPSDTDDQVPQITVVFDNIDGSITEAIRTLIGRPRVEFEVILASSPNTVEAGPYNFTIMSAQYDAKTITCSLGFEEDILNQSVPTGTYNPSNSPGLFV
jgi:hypothetical protein